MLVIQDTNAHSILRQSLLHNVAKSQRLIQKMILTQEGTFQNKSHFQVKIFVLIQPKNIVVTKQEKLPYM